MKILLIWGHKFRPWGYEVRVDLQDNSDHIYNEVLTFPGLPDEETIAKAVEALVLRVENNLVAQALEQAQEPMRKAQEVKTEFMSAVSAGLIKADAAMVELQSYIIVKPVMEPIQEFG